MVKIISDSSTLYTQEEAKQLGFVTNPICISIDDWHIRDLEVDMKQFYAKIEQGGVPTSSQPSLGEVLESYEAYPEDDIINIAMADGLSGTYNSACTAKEMAENSEKITVFNSKTLCGPHRYIVEQAVEKAKAGISKVDILAWLNNKIQTSDSFLVPQDFAFLKRGGRLTPLAATFGGLLKLKPILRITPDGKRLDKFGMKRTMSSVTESIIKHMKSVHMDEKYIIFISHANVLADAKKVEQLMKEAFPKVEVKMHKLSPAFVTQGGPGCIAIQYIQR